MDLAMPSFTVLSLWVMDTEKTKRDAYCTSWSGGLATLTIDET